MERIIATYRIEGEPASSGARAEALATEQSVEMPLEAIRDEHVMRDVVARVEAIREGPRHFEVDIAIAPVTTGMEASQLMNMLFGNCSLQPDISLVDVRFPAGYEHAFPGPRFGIEGLRALAHAHDRPLTCAALKPQGSTPEHLASLAATFATAGIDVIKDDHGIANTSYGGFERRVAAVQKAVHRANRESGGHTLYAPVFSGAPRALAEQARVAHDHGVGLALVAPMLVGIPAFVELQAELDIPVIAHPAFAGTARIAPPLLLGKLFRLFGADATIFPNHGGRFSYSRDTCLAIARAATEPLLALRAALPVPAGGMTVARVPEMAGDYGTDVMLLIGGGLLSAGHDLAERSREFVRAAQGRSAHGPHPAAATRIPR